MQDLIAEEAACYLAVVEYFGSLGCLPHWRPEPRAIDSLTRLLADERRKQ